MVCRNVEKLKRRRKKYAKEKESLDADNHLSYKHKAQSDEAEAKNTLQDMLVTDKESHKETNDEVKNTLQDMLVNDKGNQKDTNDELVQFCITCHTNMHITRPPLPPQIKY